MRVLIIAAIYIVTFLCSSTQEVFADQLANIREAGLTVSLQGDDKTGLQLDVRGVTPSTQSPTTQIIENPTRLVIDIPHKKRAGDIRKQVAPKYGLERIRLGGHPGKVRIVLDLTDQDLREVQLEDLIGTKGFLRIRLAKTQQAAEQKTEKEFIKEAPKKKEIVKQAPKPPVVVQKKKIPVPLEVTVKPVEQALSNSKLSKRRKIPTFKRKKKVSNKKAYTVAGENIAVVPVAPKKGFSKTPKNQAADYTATQEQNTLPTILGTKNTNAYLDLDKVEELPQEENKVIEQPVVVPVQKEETVPIAAVEEAPKPAIRIPEKKEEILTSEVEIPFTNDDYLAESEVPFIEEAIWLNGMYELILSLLAVTLLAVFLLRRREILSLFLGKSKPQFADEAMTFRIHEEDITLPYIVLGCKETDSDETIKARYRHLVKIFHTDKLSSQELPQEVLELTDQQFNKIQEAYDQIRDMRSLGQ